jgi:hypothetical protein
MWTKGEEKRKRGMAWGWEGICGTVKRKEKGTLNLALPFSVLKKGNYPVCLISAIISFSVFGWTHFVQLR